MRDSTRPTHRPRHKPIWTKFPYRAFAQPNNVPLLRRSKSNVELTWTQEQKSSFLVDGIDSDPFEAICNTLNHPADENTEPPAEINHSASSNTPMVSPQQSRILQPLKERAYNVNSLSVHPLNSTFYHVVPDTVTLASSSPEQSRRDFKGALVETGAQRSVIGMFQSEAG